MQIPLFRTTYNNLRNRVQADHRRNRADPCHQIDITKSEPEISPDRVRPHKGQDHSHYPCNQSFYQGFSRDSRDDCQSEKCQRGIFRRPKAGTQPRQRRGKRHQHQPADQTAESRGKSCPSQRLGSFPLLCHGISVQAGDYSRRRSWNVEQRSGNCPACHSPDIGAQHHTKSACGHHGKSQRNQKRHPHRSWQSRQCPEYQSQKCTSRHHPDNARI